MEKRKVKLRMIRVSSNDKLFISAKKNSWEIKFYEMSGTSLMITTGLSNVSKFRFID